jgi:hypothetical protein
MTSREREDADRTYNDALTTLDAALQRLRDVPHPPPPYDKRQLMPLNERWGLLSVRPIGQGCRERLRSVIWLTVAPLFKRQHTFNAALVEHLNRNTSVHQEVTASAATTLAFIHEEVVKANKFQARLITIRSNHHTVCKHQRPRERRSHATDKRGRRRVSHPPSWRT